jgi:hypothetical protein
MVIAHSISGAACLRARFTQIIIRVGTLSRLGPFSAPHKFLGAALLFSIFKLNLT